MCVSKVGSLGDKPAALLAKALAHPGGNDRRCFRVEFAHFVAAVIVFSVAQIRVASLRLATWSAQRVSNSRLARSRPSVQAANEIVVSGGEVSAASQIKPDSVGREIEGSRDVDFGLGNEEVVRRPGS